MAVSAARCFLACVGSMLLANSAERIVVRFEHFGRSARMHARAIRVSRSLLFCAERPRPEVAFPPRAKSLESHHQNLREAIPPASTIVVGPDEAALKGKSTLDLSNTTDFQNHPIITMMLGVARHLHLTAATQGNPDRSHSRTADSPESMDRIQMGFTPLKANVGQWSIAMTAMIGRMALVITAVAAVAVCTAVKLATAQTTQASLLFVQTAQKIDYKDGVMTLHDVPSQTIFFTDRPNRVVGNLPTNAFVAKWTTDKGPNGFASNPPNAAVTVFQPDGIRTAVVELSNPRLDGSKLSYNVKVLQGIASTQPASGVLVIDDFPEAWARNAFQIR
jgi:hypothetical protein